MIINKLFTKVNYTDGRKGQKIKYIVIHYTANNGDKAINNARYLYANNRNRSAHYFVDENSVYQVVRDEDTAWSVGSNYYVHEDCRNANSLNVELCSRCDKSGHYYFDAETVKNAVNLVRYLRYTYNIPMRNILRHYDVTGKNCPAPYVESLESWLTFKSLVEHEEEEKEVQTKIKINNVEFDGILCDGISYVKVRDIDKIIKTAWEGLSYEPGTKNIKI